MDSHGSDAARVRQSVVKWSMVVLDVSKIYQTLLIAMGPDNSKTQAPIMAIAHSGRMVRAVAAEPCGYPEKVQ